MKFVHTNELKIPYDVGYNNRSISVGPEIERGGLAGIFILFWLATWGNIRHVGNGAAPFWSYPRYLQCHGTQSTHVTIMQTFSYYCFMHKTNPRPQTATEFDGKPI